ncbi:glycoprotein-N-acetylgalactosamine 3-beta-galactosyltransferase 1-like [Mytilus galloprovincialis]|uniref:glycoprotein-N-acetylgalactosamine 3-beta-galactosyltransferase 1-like n=1 Tax=Mytilus galloprovincialis TaxID=29158 RepID=UPI003F7C02A4
MWTLFRKRGNCVVICLITLFTFVTFLLQTQQQFNVIPFDGNVLNVSRIAKGHKIPKPLPQKITLSNSSPVVETEKHEVKFRRPIARNKSPQSPLPTSIMCLVLTTHTTLLSKAKAVNDTWGKRCNKTIFFTNRPSTLPNVVYLDLAKDGRKHLTDKVVRIFDYVHTHFTEYDWFLKADDDTYVILENLRHFLSYFKSTEPVYLGQNYKLYTKQGYHSGGAGYVLSKEALNKLMFGIKYKNCPKDGKDEDVDIGKCLDSQGVSVYDTTDKFNRETFHGGTMEDHMVGPLSDLLKNYPSTPSKTGKDCCSTSTITFHYVSPKI